MGLEETRMVRCCGGLRQIVLTEQWPSVSCAACNQTWRYDVPDLVRIMPKFRDSNDQIIQTFPDGDSPIGCSLKLPYPSKEGHSVVIDPDEAWVTVADQDGAIVRVVEAGTSVTFVTKPCAQAPHEERYRPTPGFYWDVDLSGEQMFLERLQRKTEEQYE